MFKSKALRQSLRSWNSLVFEDLHQNIIKGINELNIIQQAIENLGFTSEKAKRELEAHNIFYGRLKQKELLYKEKSRINWLNKGDRNTTLFHGVRLRETPQSCIHSLWIDDNMIKDDSIIKQHIVDYYMNLFATPQCQQSDFSSFLDVDFCTITSFDNDSLIMMHFYDQIKSVVDRIEHSSASRAKLSNMRNLKNVFQLYASLVGQKVNWDKSNIFFNPHIGGRLTDKLHEIIPNLEELALNSKEAIMIEQRQFPQNLFDKLKTLRLQCFHDESEEFQFDVLERFRNMEKLFIVHGLFKLLFSYGLVGEEEHAKTLLARIRHLRLYYLPNLVHIWDQAFPTDQLLPNLGTLQVWSCYQLISLAPSTASFHNLKSLDVWDCSGLRCLISSSTARSLVQLTEIRIRSCSRMIEIVAEEDRAENEIVFTKLQSLKLDCLTSLVNFCSAILTFRFPSLSKVIVTQCPAMETFTHDGEALRTPKLQKVWVTEEMDKGRWTGDLNNTIRQLYAEKNALDSGDQE